MDVNTHRGRITVPLQFHEFAQERPLPIHTANGYEDAVTRSPRLKPRGNVPGASAAAHGTAARNRRADAHYRRAREPEMTRNTLTAAVLKARL